MDPLGVECTFQADGSVQVRRVRLEGRWQSVAQGRQWLDAHGRHALVMLPDDQVQELLLRPETLTWTLVPAPPKTRVV